MTERRAIAVELCLVTALLLAAAHGLYLLRGNLVVGPYVSAIIAILFLYAPILVLGWRKRRIDFLDHGWRAYARSAAVFAAAAAVVFPLFLLAAHGWELVVLKATFVRPTFAPGMGNLVLAQLLLVALPEEFYFRGYLQSALGGLFARRWTILGVRLGWAWILTAAIFAVAHSIVFYRWWHFAIFFPALLFGYLRERTGTITAPVLFHALSNIVMDLIGRSYA